MSRKIVAIGKNYLDHVKEMGGSKPLLEPVVFLKPFSSVIRPGQAIVIPAGVGEVHHEVELAVLVGKRLKHAAQSACESAIQGVGVGLDMTARDLQAKAKAAGLPWSRSKCYDTFTPLSEFVPLKPGQSIQQLDLWLDVDGVRKQTGSTASMIFPVLRLMEYVSSIMTLEDGDVILTGTPAGVGPVFPGQVITAGITGVSTVSFPVISE